MFQTHADRESGAFKHMQIENLVLSTSTQVSVRYLLEVCLDLILICILRK